MSQLHSKTKKVTAYGRKKSRIISLYNDWEPETDSITPSDQLQTPFKAATPSVGTTPAKRAPLQIKARQNDVRSSALAEAPVVKGGKGKAKLLSVEVPRLKAAEQRTRRGRVDAVPRYSREETPILAGLRSAGLRGEAVKCQQLTVARVANDNQVKSNAAVADLQAQMKTLAVSSPQPNPLQALLRATSQSAPLPFNDLFASTNPLTSILQSVSASYKDQPAPATIKGIRGRVIRPQTINDLMIRKIGEASFSEVFGVSEQGGVEVVMKVVPLLPFDREIKEGKEGAVDEPDASEMSDVLKEVEITRTMSGVGVGFVRYHGCFIVDGPYPEVLLDCWDDYKWAKSTSSYRPSNLPNTQQYAVLILSNEGIDLESFKFDAMTGWTQALAVFEQVSDALARAEQTVQFEHRDLHAGQIMIAFDPSRATNVKATMIDFGLSRIMKTGEGGQAIWSEPPSDVFEGIGAQWDVYRQMRNVVKNDWEGYHPVTNVLWLRHVLDVMLRYCKSLRKPRVTGVAQGGGKGDSSPMRTRRVGAGAVKRPAAGPAQSEIVAWQRLVELDAALSSDRLISAQDVTRV